MENIVIGQMEVQELRIESGQSVKLIARDQCMVIVEALSGSILWIYAFDRAKVFATYESGATVHYSASSEATVKLFRTNKEAK